MKKTYRITLIDSTNKHVAFRVLAADMATAIRAAQAKAEVPATTEPTSCACDGQIDIEA